MLARLIHVETDEERLYYNMAARCCAHAQFHEPPLQDPGRRATTPAVNPGPEPPPVETGHGSGTH
jgi:hypothetical protein